MSREFILKAVSANQPDLLPLPDIAQFTGDETALVQKFSIVLNAIGGKVYYVPIKEDITEIVAAQYKGRIINKVGGLNLSKTDMPHDSHALEDTDLALLEAQFAVAENGAIWLTEAQMGNRVLPFIAQHLAVVIGVSQILPTMHEAYQKIGDDEYGFGLFIAGPSKTADIEQSLVLGAHGARSMTVFIVG